MSSGLIQSAVELIFGSCCRRRSFDPIRFLSENCPGLELALSEGSDRGDDSDVIVVFLRPIYMFCQVQSGEFGDPSHPQYVARRCIGCFVAIGLRRWRCGSVVTFNPGTARSERASEGRLRFSRVCEQTIPRAGERASAPSFGWTGQRKLYCYFFGCERAARPSIPRSSSSLSMSVM